MSKRFPVIAECDEKIHVKTSLLLLLMRRERLYASGNMEVVPQFRCPGENSRLKERSMTLRNRTLVKVTCSFVVTNERQCYSTIGFLTPDE